MPRWFYHDDLEKEIISLSEHEQRHVFNVNRLCTGDELVLTDGKGTIVLSRINKDNSISVISREHSPVPEKRIHLFIAPPRKNQMDQILSQAVELGAWGIYPMICERSVVIPDKDSSPGKWLPRLIESCKQAHNPFIPEIHRPVPFAGAVNHVNNFQFTPLFGSLSPGDHKIAEIKFKPDIAWFVGPEGGFSENETGLMMSNGFHPIRIGSYVMRVETACIAGLASITKLATDGCDKEVAKG